MSLGRRCHLDVKQDKRDEGHPLKVLNFLYDAIEQSLIVGKGSTMQWIISEPFNFQHLTHTERNQYQQIQEASHDDFVSEFSAMRASQVPRRELRGIKAETIARQDPSETPPSIPTSPYCSPPRTPRRPSDGLPKSSPNHSPRAISHEPSTSIDSFAHHNLQPKQEMESQYTLPSRSVLRYSPPQFSTPGQGDEESPVESCFEASIASEDSTPYDIPIATFDGAAYDFTTPHAVTTPDDAAHILTPPPFEMVRTELSRVVEEDEHSEGRRSSTTTLARRPSASGSSLRHVKSFPSTRQPLEQSGDPVANTYRENVQSSPKKQRRSIKILQPSFDDAICDVPLSRQSQRFSATFKDAEGNWEDLVDWCYDHNAEADCNFDFTRAGSPVPEVGTQTAENPEDDLGTLHSIEGGLHSGAFKARRSSSVYSTSPPALPPLQTSLPELEPASAISAQSSFASVSEAITPVQSTTDLLPTQFSLSGSKTSFSKPTGHHSPHVSNDHTSHEMYEDLCQEMYSRDSYQYGRIDGSTISSASPRSSHSPISKCSSQESFWARHHKANSSASSLPDLVHNRSSREKAEPFPDILAEQMAPLNEEQQALASRRRSPGSLVKDVAQKNLLSRIQNGSIDDATNAEVPLPLHPALRDRAGSEAAFRDPDLVVPPFARPPTARMRSASSAANVKSVNISPRGSRASYGLYPKHTVR